MKKQAKTKRKELRQFIIGTEDLEGGMIIEAEDLDDAREKVNMMIDIHEVDEDGEFID